MNNPEDLTPVTLSSKEQAPNALKTHRTIELLALIVFIILGGLFLLFLVNSSVQEEEAQIQPTTEPEAPQLSFALPDTGQTRCYNNSKEITCNNSEFFGQDAQYQGNTPSYSLSTDGLTVTDDITGLTWMRGPNTTLEAPVAADKISWEEVAAYVTRVNNEKYAGYSDWRLPNIKELYSLILFDGTDPSACQNGQCNVTPFIDTEYFNFGYGDTSAGERYIDSQYLSSTVYIDSSANIKGAKVFGVNFADGRIKGYDTTLPSGTKKYFFAQLVRGNTDYGKNEFKLNADGTISDLASGLVWSREDSGVGMNWQEALEWVQEKNSENYLGFNDWRLPNAKELQSILDYERAPGISASAAIDPIFYSTSISNERGESDYPYYWTSTTHLAAPATSDTAAYLSFGRAMGYMDNNWLDVHGAGAQRSDPKTGDAANFPQGHGPQGDAIRINNFVRLVRSGTEELNLTDSPITPRPSQTLVINSEGNGQAETPPLEAQQACIGKTTGASCSFTTPKGLINGSCRELSNILACVP